MTAIFLILFTIAAGVAAAGLILLVPAKGRRNGVPAQGPVSPESMVQVRPAGPGRLRMSFTQGDRMPMEVMLQAAEIREDTDLDRLRDPARSPEEKQEIVNRLRSMGYEISYDPLAQGRTAPPVHSPSAEGQDPAPARVVEPEDASVRMDGSPADERYDDYLTDTEAMVADDATESQGEAVPLTVDDERLREKAEREFPGGVQVIEPGLDGRDGHEGDKAVSLMEFLSMGRRNGSVPDWVVAYAGELLNISVTETPRGQVTRPAPARDFQHGGPRDISWDGLDDGQE